jgi:hypothetical protein
MPDRRCGTKNIGTPLQPILSLWSKIAACQALEKPARIRQQSRDSILKKFDALEC